MLCNVSHAPSVTFSENRVKLVTEKTHRENKACLHTPHTRARMSLTQTTACPQACRLFMPWFFSCVEQWDEWMQHLHIDGSKHTNGLECLQPPIATSVWLHSVSSQCDLRAWPQCDLTVWSHSMTLQCNLNSMTSQCDQTALSYGATEQWDLTVWSHSTNSVWSYTSA